ncbi:MAG: TonB-dependent receptor [Alphaproteobacteria bacterium]
MTLRSPGTLRPLSSSPRARRRSRSGFLPLALAATLFADATLAAAEPVARARAGSESSAPAAPQETAEPAPDGRETSKDGGGGDAAKNGDDLGHFSFEETTVTATPLGRTVAELAQPVTILKGEELVLKNQPTLGDTLATQPGVSSTYYGPGASRPVIRGLDGERVRILQNGVNTIDASATSVDHTLTIEPMNVKRVDVVRGPATLMYGSSAVGGVVNVIDGRVPSERVDHAFGGQLKMQGSSVDASPSGATWLTGGSGPIAWQLNGFARKADDLSIPGYARTKRLREEDPLPPGEKEPYGTLPNSAITTWGGGGGLSFVTDSGYLGVAPSRYKTDYGTVAQPDVTIDLGTTRFDVAGGVENPVAWIEQLTGKFAWSDYEHVELEGAEVGTIFRNQGYDGRLDATHAAFGPVEGAVGFETQAQRLSALGEEAFLPSSRTWVNSGFVFEEVALDPFLLQAGFRLDYQQVEAIASETFGPGEDRGFLTPSGSLGTVYTPADGWNVALSLAFTNRAPTPQELFADGPHVATGIYEVGERNLGVEHGLGIDLSLRKTLGRVSGSLTGFYDRFDDFIALFPTGLVDPASDLPIYLYRAVPADLAGMEMEAAVPLFESAPHRLRLELQSDYVWAQERSNDEPLPRMPPFRFGAGLVYEVGGFTARADWLQVASQTRNPSFQTFTPGYTMLNLFFTYDLPQSLGLPSGTSLFLRATNLLDETARDSVSVLKDIAPLPGIGVAGGLTLAF